jgi:hypothetical protein
MPEGVDDRAADCWEPLLAIGDLFGSAWSARARRAAQEIVAGRIEEDDSVGVQLLLAIHGVFTEDYTTMHTSDLVTRLNEYEEANYRNWNNGRGINAMDLARILKRYDIRPKDVRAGALMANKKGYERGMFQDAWKRYAGGETGGDGPRQARQTGATDATRGDTFRSHVARVAGSESRRGKRLHKVRKGLSASSDGEATGSTPPNQVVPWLHPLPSSASKSPSALPTENGNHG